MVFATLGTIRFNLLTGPRRFRRTRKYGYAEHANLTGKPKLQDVGDPLDEIDILLQFHRQFCDPQAQLDALIDAAEAKQELSFVVADRRLGLFVIDGLDENVNKLYSVPPDEAGGESSQALLLSVDVKVSLREYVGEKRQSPALLTAFARLRA